MEADSIFTSPHLSFFAGGPADDVVLMSRVSLSRNFKELPFPNRASFEQERMVIKWFEPLIPAITKATGQPFTRLELDKLTPLERGVLCDKMLTDEEYVAKTPFRVVFVSADESIVLSLNGAEHLLITCFAGGLSLQKPLSLASAIDDVIEDKIDYAFDERMGYLSAIPTNFGTGMRAMVLFHLPGLSMTQNINNIVKISPQLGFAARPLINNDDGFPGCLLSLTNQITLGLSESEIAENLKSAASEIVTHERRSRKAIMLHAKDQLSDNIWRAFGLMRYAYTLDAGEVMTLMSKVRLGIDLQIIDGIAAGMFTEILVSSRNDFLKNQAGNDNMSKIELDKLRAKQVQLALKSHSLRGDNE